MAPSAGVDRPQTGSHLAADKRLAKRIRVDVTGCKLSTIIDNLSRDLKMKLALKAPLNNDFITLHVKAQPAHVVMELIANAVHGEWVANSVGYRLERTSRIAEQARQLDDKYQRRVEESIQKEEQENSERKAQVNRLIEEVLGESRLSDLEMSRIINMFPLLRDRLASSPLPDGKDFAPYARLALRVVTWLDPATRQRLRNNERLRFSPADINSLGCHTDLEFTTLMIRWQSNGAYGIDVVFSKGIAGFFLH